jgi:hypothetical protein
MVDAYNIFAKHLIIDCVYIKIKERFRIAEISG